MSNFLPKELEFVPLLPSLGESTVNTSIVLAPSNGATFGENGIVVFDLPARPNTFLDPSTLYIRYKIAVSSAVLGAEIKGTPIYTPFSNLQVQFGSQIVESINQYGVVQSMLTNLTHGPSSKAGVAACYGYTDFNATTIGANMNGRTTSVANESYTVSGPLRCILSEANRLIPLGLLPAVRIQFTIDTLLNIATTTQALTGLTISNFELCFDSISMDQSVTNVIAGMGEKIYIKSQSYATSSATLAAGTTGTVNLLFNTRLSSVKSLFLICGGTAAASLNKLYDSYDITSGAGSYQFLISGIPYPTRPLSTSNNKAGIMSELRLAVGGLSPAYADMSISTAEFNYVSAGVSTCRQPAKFFVSSNVERMHSNSVLLSGISTQSSPISLQAEISVATGQAHTLMLVCAYDALIEITPAMKDATVKM